MLPGVLRKRKHWIQLQQCRDWIENLSAWGYLGWVVLFFFLTRLWIYSRIPFYYDSIGRFMQFLDKEILQDNLLQGLWYLHVQPPLFNLFLGIVRKVTPDPFEPIVFEMLFGLMGLGLILSSMVILERLKIIRMIAMPGLIGMMLFPPLYGAERCIAYTLPLVLFLTTASLLWLFYCQSRQVRCLAGFWFILTLVVLTRSFFHWLLWWLPLVAISLLLAWRWNPQIRLRLVLVSLSLFLLAGFPYLLNQWRYGQLTASTWFGLNWVATTRYVPQEQIDSLIKSGMISEIMRIPRFSSPETYLDYFQKQGVSFQATGKPVLDALKRTGGAINWNHPVYIPAGREYGTSTRRVIVAEPGAYALSVLNQAWLFFGFTPGVFFDTPGVWDITQYQGLERVQQFIKIYLSHFLFALLYLIVLFYYTIPPGWSWKYQGCNHTKNNSDMSLSGWPIGFGWFPAAILFYTCGVALLFELGEGCFMRTPVDPLFWIGLCCLIDRMTSFRRKSRNCIPMKND